MRIRSFALHCLLALSVACGDPSSAPDVAADAAADVVGAAGSAGAAGQAHDAATGGAAGQDGDAAVGDAAVGDAAVGDAAVGDAAVDDAEADALDACGDAWTTIAPPLNVEESELILAGDETTPMEMVTNATLEDDDFLHQVALPIDPSDDTVQHLIARMRATLAASPGGVGLAAPQVRISRRLFLAARTDQSGSPVQPFLNPVILASSSETAAGMEGCLSVPGSNVSVTRAKWVTLLYDTADGDQVCGETIGSTTSSSAAFAARIVQHEYDHLDGILIVDD